MNVQTYIHVVYSYWGEVGSAAGGGLGLLLSALLSRSVPLLSPTPPLGTPSPRTTTSSSLSWLLPILSFPLVRSLLLFEWLTFTRAVPRQSPVLPGAGRPVLLSPGSCMNVVRIPALVLLQDCTET